MTNKNSSDESRETPDRIDVPHSRRNDDDESNVHTEAVAFDPFADDDEAHTEAVAFDPFADDDEAHTDAVAFDPFADDD
ncbi:hypothetical protein, partial [Corynebacterium auriscanis]|uniref:hypothetical protein n=1 Tax=Corynebacterium auriscanis TaxID=99807 RepID=UPI0024AD28CA